MNLRNSSPAGFTLVELLTVVIIIGILAGLVIAAGKYALSKGETSRAQAEIAVMENALEHYKSDNGVYPTTPNGRPVSAFAYPYGNSVTLYLALAGGPGYSKTYMQFKSNQLRVDSSGKTYLVDPFGSAYNYYCFPGAVDQTNTASFDLWSYGPSGLNGDPNMVTNWKQ